MSPTPFSTISGNPHLCQRCQGARCPPPDVSEALAADVDHAPSSRVLCLPCFRAARDRQRAGRLAEIAPFAALRAPVPRKLTERQLAHRQGLLAHLERQRHTRM